MLLHCGPSLDTGHYYCFQLIQQQWYLFNDAKVTPATWSDLESVARGDSATHCPTVLFYQRADYAQAGDDEVSSPERGRVLTYLPFSCLLYGGCEQIHDWLGLLPSRILSSLEDAMC